MIHQAFPHILLVSLHSDPLPCPEETTSMLGVVVLGSNFRNSAWAYRAQSATRGLDLDSVRTSQHNGSESLSLCDIQEECTHGTTRGLQQTRTCSGPVWVVLTRDRGFQCDSGHPGLSRGHTGTSGDSKALRQNGCCLELGTAAWFHHSQFLGVGAGREKA